METLSENGMATSSEVAIQKRPFIEANTIEMDADEMSKNHIIPVFVRDNEPAISHSEFIDVVQSEAEEFFGSGNVLQPDIRVSHPIKGRIPEAKHKKAIDLLETEKTIYYERMAFVTQIATERAFINGQELLLTVGGVKAYNEDKLSTNRRKEQQFRVFIGYQNTLCTNLCIWTDGAKMEFRITNIEDLAYKISKLIKSYEPEEHMRSMELLSRVSISDEQFAKVIGRAKMSQYVKPSERYSKPKFPLTDRQINQVVEGFYKDKHFNSRDGELSMWQFYNLLTGANKSSYVDSILQRGSDCFSFCNQLAEAIDQGRRHWYLS